MTQKLHLILFTLLTHFIVVGQGGVNTIYNQSFENLEGHSIAPWYDCGSSKFAGEASPVLYDEYTYKDMHKPAHGLAYIILKTKDNGTYEQIAQSLDFPLEKGKCYMLSVELAKNKTFDGKSRTSGELVSYTTPAVLRIWGGTSACSERQLLAQSKPIDHTEWKNYSFALQPLYNHKYIFVEAYYTSKKVSPYNGHIIVDRFTDIFDMECGGQ
jgi:hypothetical protein